MSFSGLAVYISVASCPHRHSRESGSPVKQRVAFGDTLLTGFRVKPGMAMLPPLSFAQAGILWADYSLYCRNDYGN